jgi:hypothetical protein
MPSMNRRTVYKAGAWVAAVAFIIPVASSEEPKDSLAAQIRTQGYRCERPIDAQRDAALSRPGEAVWLLRCENGTYRLRLIPDMAARVERVN